ncbi:MAG TPA: NAD(+)/NADH kinase [bacterium]|nr:NAD(+)/NADH kinase [bacterium]
MSQIRALGVLVRDDTQPYPLESLQRLLDGARVRMHLLNNGLPTERLDVVVAMGGDGTVLKALDMMPDCPVLAINFGTVGFLTAGDRAELEQLVGRLLAGDFVVSERVLLRCQHPGGTAHVVNEVVLRSSWRLMSVDVTVNGAHIRSIRADGVIVGTPTGSTGYLLSTGAPIVMPDVSCFVLDGLNEYNFTSRALILSPDSKIRLLVTALHGGEEARVYIDGNAVGALEVGQQLLLERSPRRAQLIFFDPNYFFHNLTSRLRW